jgi:hypothetical protein
MCGVYAVVLCILKSVDRLSDLLIRPYQAKSKERLYSDSVRSVRLFLYVRTKDAHRGYCFDLPLDSNSRLSVRIPSIIRRALLVEITNDTRGASLSLLSRTSH